MKQFGQKKFKLLKSFNKTYVISLNKYNGEYNTRLAQSITFPFKFIDKEASRKNKEKN